MADPPDIETALYSKLSGTAAITALVGTKIYLLHAPSGTARPYLVFYAASELETNNSPRHDWNDVFRIEGVADSRSGAAAIHRAAYGALHYGDLPVTGWSVYWLAHEGKRVLVENVEGKQFWRYIGEFRIRLDRS